MREFGETSGLSAEVTENIRQIIENLKSLSIQDLSIYYGYPLIELDNQESVMKCCILSRTGIIALYEEESEENVYKRHFTQIIMKSPEFSNLFFAGISILECIKLTDIEAILSFVRRKELLSHEQYIQLNGIVQNVYGMNASDARQISKINSLGEIIKKRTNAMNMLDQNQFNGIYNRINTHMRIRGLAGSGKTILLVKKMAYTHFKYRDLGK